LEKTLTEYIRTGRYRTVEERKALKKLRDEEIKKGRKINKPKRGKKIGIIQAYRMDIDHDPAKKIVCIVHAKANLQRDDFDEDTMWTIINQRLEYVLYNYKDTDNKRLKPARSVSDSLRKQYDDMLYRTKQYFKDCVNFYSYIDMFNYIEEDEDEIRGLPSPQRFKLHFEEIDPIALDKRLSESIKRQLSSHY